MNGDEARAELWAARREHIANLADVLRDDVADACPGPHNPVQHRDRMRPWCRACGRTSDGVQVSDRQLAGKARRRARRL